MGAGRLSATKHSWINNNNEGLHMKMDKVAGSGNDEFYTPNYAIEPILKYLSPPRQSGVHLTRKIVCL